MCVCRASAKQRMMFCIERLIENKLYVTALFILWGSISVVIFSQLGAFHMKFMHVGPSSDCVFLGLQVDTWPKWTFVAGFSFLNTLLNELFGNILFPFFTNTIMDHKAHYIPYSRWTCNAIACLYDIYTHVMSFFAIYLLFSQIDFLVIRCFADVLSTLWTNAYYLQYKIHDPLAYSKESGVVPILDVEMQPLTQENTNDKREGGEEDNHRGSLMT